MLCWNTLRYSGNISAINDIFFLYDWLLSFSLGTYKDGVKVLMSYHMLYAFMHAHIFMEPTQTTQVDHFFACSYHNL